ncbi:MAG: hypothetical protein IJ864_06395 [Alphaproteobacteria bacterium]|nr:hypothetical protein [Alphaproteobacteria bacterium]
MRNYEQTIIGLFGLTDNPTKLYGWFFFIERVVLDYPNSFNSNIIKNKMQYLASGHKLHKNNLIVKYKF